MYKKLKETRSSKNRIRMLGVLSHAHHWLMFVTRAIQVTLVQHHGHDQDTQAKRE